MKPIRKRTRKEIRAALKAGENNFNEAETTGMIEVALELTREEQEQAQQACRKTAQIAGDISRALKNSSRPPPPTDEQENDDLSE